VAHSTPHDLSHHRFIGLSAGMRAGDEAVAGMVGMPAEVLTAAGIKVALCKVDGELGADLTGLSFFFK
jgi:hypothetical protein